MWGPRVGRWWTGGCTCPGNGLGIVGPERCAAAGAPADCRERRSQTELALEMLAGAQARGQLAAQWLAGDSACGGMRYVRDARPDMTVWPLEPTWTDPPYQGNGRPRKPRLRGGQRQTMAERAAAIPEDGGREITIAQGSQGPRAYRYSAQRVRVTHRRQPGEVLGARSSGRSIARTGMAAASPAITSPTLPRTRRWKPWPAWAAPAGASQPSSRPRKAPLGGTSAKSAPGRAGIITSHHITMRLLAGAFLLTLQQDWREKMPRITRDQVYRVVRELMPKERFGPEELLLWLAECPAT